MKPLVFRRVGRSENFAWFLYVGTGDAPDGYLVDREEAAERENLRAALERIASSPSVVTGDDLRYIAEQALKGNL